MDTTNDKTNDKLIILKLDAQRRDYMRELAYMQGRIKEIERELKERGV